MGLYINKDSKGDPLSHNKAKSLINDGAQVISPPHEWEENIVCVVDNGPFMAAGYCFSPDEMDAFKYEDGRQKVWLKYEHAKALAE